MKEGTLSSSNVTALDFTGTVPGYEDWIDPREVVIDAIGTVSAVSISVVFDSLDTLCSDLGSVSETCAFVVKLMSQIRDRPRHSRLVMHILHPSPLFQILVQTHFSSPLTHLIAHPPALLLHLAKEYLTPPPPASAPEKFWRVFIPVSERDRESEKLVFVFGGEGINTGDFVVEILTRGLHGPGRRRGVERSLEGWSVALNGACELDTLQQLKPVWPKAVVESTPLDPTQNVSFNLSLTPSQQESRSRVPLPYAHEGKMHEQSKNPAAAILYDPDSADDLDDEDPDEDLDI